MGESIFKVLDLDTVVKIRQISPFKTLAKETVIAYEGQVPNFAVLLNSGNVSLKTGDLIQFDFPVLVFYDLIKEEGVAEEQVSIHEGAEISILDRAILKELQQNKILF